MGREFVVTIVVLLVVVVVVVIWWEWSYGVSLSHFPDPPCTAITFPRDVRCGPDAAV